jgi:LysR family transcriptional regulator, nitrogen assimilation regulatory protein|uniref:LysR family transcriptional regulator n=1 Tax=Orrella sp. TaxID=1921583 RepID=UPI0040474BC1
MDLKQIQYFVALYEEQSVTRAAQRLNIVQPALSMQIAKLERDVGRQLFRRSARGMTPTPAGDEMHATFAPIISAFTTARAKVVRSGGELSGHVQVGVVASLGHSILPNTLMRFMAEHPRVTLSFMEGLTDTISESVANGQLDLALINRPTRPTGLTIKQVIKEEVLLVSSHNAPEDIAAHVRLSEVKDRPFIMPTKSHGLRQLITRALTQANLSIIPVLEIDSFTSIATLVNEGQYLTFFPEDIVRNLRWRASINLRTHHLTAPTMHREIVCATNPRRPLSPAAEKLSTALISAICAAQAAAQANPGDNPAQY